MTTFPMFPLKLANFNVCRSTCQPKLHSLGETRMKQAMLPWQYFQSKRKLMRPLLAMDDSSRHLANFHSTVWGYHFLSYDSQLTEISSQEKVEVEELKEKVMNMLMETPDNCTQKLVLIDTIQRLGVAYHFHDEIKTFIQNIFDESMFQQNHNKQNLYVVALCFRLVRQQGHYISAGETRMKQAMLPWQYFQSKRKLMRPLLAMDDSSRHLANFHSTVWGYHFLSYDSQLTEISSQEKVEVEELKEKVMNMLMETPDNCTQKLVLIDTIQRLGVAYHFHDEIKTFIQNIFDESMFQQNHNKQNLYVVALCFRLVRQQGHYISAGETRMKQAMLPWQYFQSKRKLMRPLLAMDDSSRHLANFHSTVWGYHFLSYDSQLTEISSQEKVEVEELKEKVMNMLMETPDNCTQKLVLIDTIQRLGVAYHFHDEIKTFIQNIFDESMFQQNHNKQNLYVVALCFRLVRQQGHYISAGETRMKQAMLPWQYFQSKRKLMRPLLAMDDSSRHLANFHSTVWGYHFLSYDSQLTEISSQEKVEVEELKEKVMNMLMETPDNCTQKLVLIDTIQRLGVAYHFHDEIKTFIQNIFDESMFQQNHNKQNLYVVALCFRLVRQQGHYISADVFKQFTDQDGKLKETLTNDVQGLLSLYEAAHMRVHGEEILEEALTFTTTRLEYMIPMLRNPLKAQIVEALTHPIHKVMPRLGARKYIDIYEKMESHNPLLLKFSKLDFNMLQKQHQRELSELTSWWKDLDLASKVPYARDKLVEGYAWTLGLYFEPQYSRARKMLVKVFKMLSVCDDTYDAYATFEELVLFTHAMQRWDINAMDSLPSYMRPFYQAILDVFHELEQQLANEGQSERVYYGKFEMKKLARAYFKEAGWLNAGYIPHCDEYIKNGIVSTTFMSLGTTSLIGMEELISKDIFEWITNEPSIVRASSTICRLMDDISDHETDQQRGHVASIIECYMNEYGASKEETYVKFRKEVKNAWKDINKALLCPTEAPTFVLDRILNLARTMETFFQDEEDGYTNSNSKCKDIITLLLVESVNI